MAFLGHLLIIAAALLAVVGLFVAPRNALFWSATLLAGYIGSADGFGGTCLGLLVGAGIGGLLAGGFSLVARLFRRPEETPEQVVERIKREAAERR